MTGPLIRAVCCASVLLVALGVGPRAQGEPRLPNASVPTTEHPPALFSEPARLASRTLLIALASAGERLVAVGDRGHILLSDDKGHTWTQAESVPTQALLTGVCFADTRRGIAVGHDEVILTTADAGRTWNRAHYAPEAQQPLLDVWCGQGGRAIAVGAYSAYFSTEDGGATWEEGKFEAQPVRVPVGEAKGTRASHASVATSSSALLPEARRGAADKAAATQGVASAGAAAAGAEPADNIGGGFHLNRIVASSPSRLYIAAEAGHLYRSGYGGVDWVELPSPYEGSFFGVLPLAGDALLAYGLRGNLLRSEDAGLTWQRIPTGTVAMLDGAATIGNEGAHDAVAVVGLSGILLVSHDGGKSFALKQQTDRKGLSGVLAVGAGTLVTVGEGGVKLIALTATPTAARAATAVADGPPKESR
ncbi:MAG: hypothetical protein JWN85_5002 [Gammaproteobacteria bacterium]|nr:hypothetical protein [Gammaproteobacteria bacterium]